MFPLKHPLILASQSPRRAEILRMLGLEFTVRPSGCDETAPGGLEPAAVPEALARMKAATVSRAAPEPLVLGADTVVVLGNRILNKPADPEEALAMLRDLRGRAHTVFTGVALARAGTLLAAGTEKTEVEFAACEDADLLRYSRCGEPLDKAGAYAIQGRGAFLVKGIRGCFFNVMGLPVRRTLDLLRPHRAG